jgi:hypothetical protein
MWTIISKLKDNCPHFLWMLWMLRRLLVHVGFYGCYEKIVTKKYKVHSLSTLFMDVMDVT